MFMLWLYRYITGYVKFRGEGKFLERFLNLCARDGITVWESYFDGGALYGCMRVADYRKIRKNARKAKVRLRIIKRVGLNFVVHRYRFRYGLAAGAAAYFAVIMLLSSFIWCVDVAGNENIPSDKILGELARVGVYEGSIRRRIDVEDTRQRMLINCPDLSWAAINIRGCFAVADVRETEKRAPEISYDPCNVVASRGGRIISVKAYLGSPAVKVGEAVAEGDLLVSGTVELKTGATKFINATAEVIAETEHKLEIFVPFAQTDMIKSDEAEKRRVVTLFSMNIPLFLGEVEQPYESEREVKQPIINGVRLPLKITDARFYKTSPRDYTINEDEARRLAENRMEEKAKNELGDIVVSSDSGEFEVCPDGIKFVKKYVCREDIAKQANILINS